MSNIAHAESIVWPKRRWMDGLERLRRFARGVGVELLEVNDDQWLATMHRGGVDEAPFSDQVGCDYDANKVFVRASAKVDGCAYVLGEVIHELGHVAASAHEPMRAQELDFLGWEYALALRLRLYEAWCLHMDNYVLACGNEFGDLSRRMQRAALGDALTDAYMRGIVTSKGKPVRVAKRASA